MYSCSFFGLIGSRLLAFLHFILHAWRWKCGGHLDAIASPSGAPNLRRETCSFRSLKTRSLQVPMSIFRAIRLYSDRVAPLVSLPRFLSCYAGYLRKRNRHVLQGSGLGK